MPMQSSLMQWIKGAYLNMKPLVYPKNGKRPSRKLIQTGTGLFLLKTPKP
jgi:hypothetical protein